MKNAFTVALLIFVTVAFVNGTFDVSSEFITCFHKEQINESRILTNQIHFRFVKMRIKY